jgi:PleD family two-component response regulator
LREQFARNAMMTKAGALNGEFPAGLASRRVHGEGLDESMQAAGAALYQVKREGRNRVQLACAERAL